METNLYDMIFKRKSFHLFRGVGDEKITEKELNDIENAFYSFTPLCPEIKVKMKIVNDTTYCKRGQEYCIYLYSEKKDNYLQNIGYIGQQLDLYLVSKNIGSLWFGIGKPKDKVLDGLDYVIMFAIKKVDSPDKFRKDMFKSKRKGIDEIWLNCNYQEIANIVRFAPSACNSQPWLVEEDGKTLKVYRNSSKHGIMPIPMVPYFNQIDIGIFLCVLELTMQKNNIIFSKQLFVEENSKLNKNLTAIYTLE